jgi:hypothetical protein
MLIALLARHGFTQLLDAVSALTEPVKTNYERLRIEGHNGISPGRDAGPVDVVHRATVAHVSELRNPTDAGLEKPTPGLSTPG